MNRLFAGGSDAPYWKQWLWFKIGIRIRAMRWRILCACGRHKWRGGIVGGAGPYGMYAPYVQACTRRGRPHFRVHPAAREMFGPDLCADIEALR